MGFKVQAKMCSSCIYRPDSPLDLKKLEDQVRDKYVGFKGHRICHHSTDVCCRGFWNEHKDKFPLGQIAQRLGFVEFVKVDTIGEGTEKRGTRKGSAKTRSSSPSSKKRSSGS